MQTMIDVYFSFMYQERNLAAGLPCGLASAMTFRDSI